MKYIILLMSIGFGSSAHPKGNLTMFNASDLCRGWPAKKTAKYLINLDANNRKWEFSQIGPVVLLLSPASADNEIPQPYAVFFDDQKSCALFLKQLRN